MFGCWFTVDVFPLTIDGHQLKVAIILSLNAMTLLHVCIFQASGLSTLVGDQLSFVEVLPPQMVVLVTSAIGSVLTQIMSNTATATLCMPIMAAVVGN